MRIVIQRVSHASVTIEGICKSAIKEGFMILVGIENADTQEDADWLCKKIVNLRVFDDENGVMNKSIFWLSANSPCTPLTRKVIDPPISMQPNLTLPSHYMNTSAKH